MNKSTLAVLTDLANCGRLGAVNLSSKEAVPVVAKGAKVAGYVRVSTREQVEHGSGLQEQTDTVRTHCDREALQLVKVYTEAGVSGANGVEDRPAWLELVGDLDGGGFAGVVVPRLDRLARDLLLQETMLADLGKRGAALVSVAEPDLCSDDPGRVMIRQIMGSIAQYEKALITARLSSGRARKKAGGGYAGGWVPLGYRVTGERREAVVVVDEETAPVVRRIFEDYASGLSMKQLAEKLQAEGVPTKRGGRWLQGTVAAVLANAAYVGEEFPPLVSRELFDECERRRGKGLAVAG